VAHLALQHPPLLQKLLLPQITSVEKGGAATGSHILIAVQVALHSPAEQQHGMLPQLLKLLLPWTNHHTHHIRTFAQVGFCALLVSMCAQDMYCFALQLLCAATVNPPYVSASLRCTAATLHLPHNAQQHLSTVSNPCTSTSKPLQYAVM
jgi:hypothetical protein